MVCSERMSANATSSVAAEVTLVSNQRHYCGSGALVRGVLAVCQLVTKGDGLPGSLSRCAPSPLLSTDVSQLEGGGSIYAGPDSGGFLDGIRTHSPYQHLGDEGGAACLSCLQGSNHGKPVVLMSDNATVIVYIEKQ